MSSDAQFDRVKAIETLVQNDTIEYESLLTQEFFIYLLMDGFKGYNNMTDEELMQECEDRDISYLIGECDD